MKTIMPFLWFRSEAEEAARFYVSIFPNSKITNIVRYGDAGPGPKGNVMVVTFQLNGQDFNALNDNDNEDFHFTPAISLLVNCETQEEVDNLWSNLSDGGEELACGWVTDRFGVTWQITPTILGEMLADPDVDPERSQRVMRAMMEMVKLDIDALKRAYDGE